jgi:hypothetical protein
MSREHLVLTTLCTQSAAVVCGLLMTLSSILDCVASVAEEWIVTWRISGMISDWSWLKTREYICVLYSYIVVFSCIVCSKAGGPYMREVRLSTHTYCLLSAVKLAWGT